MDLWKTLWAGRLLPFLIFALTIIALTRAGDMLRKSIVFDESTPDVFYCPQEQSPSLEKMYVKARPLKKLCEFKGKPLPSGYKSDCFNDVDETEFACQEKYRIMPTPLRNMYLWIVKYGFPSNRNVYYLSLACS
ncbi:unnamed protein product [Cyprideis torosa]|uniref:Uncharacterized protein n=1 Tax=Cyprideis torosa TaxID=163714 RepID=A0A7R8ZHC0_9CRUS|nr:unnamed protein product [Cyprideis torosa]CAG0883338.1 unnamed protein product [Cyprideis torosa]